MTAFPNQINFLNTYITKYIEPILPKTFHKMGVYCIRSGLVEYSISFLYSNDKILFGIEGCYVGSMLTNIISLLYESPVEFTTTEYGESPWTVRFVGVDDLALLYDKNLDSFLIGDQQNVTRRAINYRHKLIFSNPDAVFKT